MSLANEDVTVTALDRLAELHAEATPGPWATDPDRVGGFDLLDADGEFVADRMGALSMADAALIVAAVNATPRLIAAIRAAYGLAEEVSDRRPRDRWIHADYLRAALDEALEVPGE